MTRFRHKHCIFKQLWLHSKREETLQYRFYTDFYSTRHERWLMNVKLFLANKKEILSSECCLFRIIIIVYTLQKRWLWGVCGKKFQQEVDPKNKPTAFSFSCVSSVSFSHHKSDAPIGCAFHQLAECGVLLDTYFCPLTFCPVVEPYN